MTRGFINHLILIIASMLFLSPASYASDTDIEKDLQEKLRQSRTLIDRAGEKFKAGDSVREEISNVITLSERIKELQPLLKEKFRIRAEKIRAGDAKARERHRVMEEGYQKTLADYLNLIESLVGAHGDAPIEAIQQTIENLKTHLKQILPKTKKSIMGSLPYRNLNYPSKEPNQGPPIIPAYKGGNKTVAPADTKSTEEAPISQGIATLAQSLNWNPVLIYEYVKNTIDTEWYWGCMKGAEETLRQKSGNDCDQATLFAALLRASGFPARYVRGTVEFFPDIEKAKNLTGVDDPWKMGEFFQKAGIPYRPIIAGGKISNFQIEHIWVESELPYDNYRGAIIDEQGKTWLGLDTSIKIKGYTYSNPMDIFQQSAISSQLSAIRDEYLGALQTQTPLEYVETKLAADGYQLTDLIKTKTLIPDIMNILPASMQFEQRRITNEYTEIPDELKHKVRFKATDKSNNELFTIVFDALELSNRQIALSYEPETVEDQEVIDSYGGVDNTPAYLVRLRPVLKIDGEMVVAGEDGLPMGEDHGMTIDLISPNGTVTTANTNITGNLTAIGITAQKPVVANADTSFSEEDDAETILFKEANRYIDRWNRAEDELASLLHLTIVRPIPTVVTVGEVIDVTYLLDVPHGYEWKGVFVDANVRAIGITPSHSPLPQEGDEERRKTFMQLLALQGSVLEHRIFEDDFRVDSISTAKLFQISNQQSASSGQLLTIDKSNIDTLLPLFDIADNIREDIRNAVNQGLIVRVPSAGGLPLSAVSYKDWTGIGYIKENPGTGEAGYMLSGMIAGGMTAVSPQKWLSADLKNRLDNPYSSNVVVTTPVMVNIIFPYDGAMLAVSPIDVEGIVSDPTAAVNINGTKATVSGSGRFIAKGVSLSSGINQITASATTIMGTHGSQTINVNYQPAQVSPMNISITSPAAGATINRPATMVRGAFTSDAKEISIKINGIPAEVYGNQFVINNLPLVEGDNVIIVNAVDSNGSIGRAEVSVKAETSNPYITLTANIISGIPPLTTYFMVSTETPNPIVGYQIDFDGDGVIDYTGETFEDITYTYTTEGIYYPLVKAIDDQGNTYTDSIAVTVLNKEAIDALLKGKWEGMKTKLLTGDIEDALNFFTTRSQEKYRIIFTALKDQLPLIFGTFIEFNITDLYEIIAEFELVANENGKLYSYPGVFLKNGNGIWKFKSF